MNWLITGGCGFIGSRLVSKLCSAGEKIRVLDTCEVGTEEDLKKSICKSCTIREISEKACLTFQNNEVQLFKGDILNRNQVDFAMQGMDVVVHLAANTGVGPSVENPEFDCFTNVIGTFNLLDASRKQGQIQRFVFASSGAPLGEVDPPIHEKLAPLPVSPYGASKLSGEGYCSAYYRTYGLETVVLRFGNVYGPGSDKKQSVVAKFIKSALKGGEIAIYGDGHQTRDYIFVDDLLNAIELSVKGEQVAGEIFQIATNVETTLNELMLKIAQSLDKAGVSQPNIIYDAPRLGDVRRNFSDTRKAKEILNWQASTSLDSGLHETVEYFKNV